jgi:hypothetical protein
MHDDGHRAVFSRFPDNATPDAHELSLVLVGVPELVTIDLDTLVVRRWGWDDGAKEFVESVVILVESLEAALAYVPQTLEPAAVPADLRMLAFRTRSAV